VNQHHPRKCAFRKPQSLRRDKSKITSRISSLAQKITLSHVNPTGLLGGRRAGCVHSIGVHASDGNNGRAYFCCRLCVPVGKTSSKVKLAALPLKELLGQKLYSGTTTFFLIMQPKGGFRHVACEGRRRRLPACTWTWTWAFTKCGFRDQPKKTIKKPQSDSGQGNTRCSQCATPL
jgi:hypothetical protein